MKKYLLFILIFAVTISAQSEASKYSEAVKTYSNHDYGTAYKLFQEVLTGEKNDYDKVISSKFYSANCLLYIDQLDGAAAEFESFIDEYKFTNLREQALYTLGTIYFTKNEYRKARERLLTLIGEYPNSILLGSSYYWLGEAYSAENKFLDAEENFREAIARRRTNQFIVNSIYSLAQVYEKTNDFRNAVNSYDELLAYYKEDPLAPKSQMRIGVCYFNLKDYDNAILELSDPLISKLAGQDLIDAKYFLANSYARLKEYKQASQVYSDLIKDITDERIQNKLYYGLAWIKFQEENYQDAYDIFHKLYQNADDSIKSNSLFWSAECKRYLGESKAAGDIYNEFISKYPSHRYISKAQLGIGTSLLNQPANAYTEKALLNATISSDRQTRARAYIMLGELRMDGKNFPDAKKYFSEAIKLMQDKSELKDRAKLGLAVSEFYLNEYDASLGNLEELRDKSKNFESDKVNFYLAEVYLIQEKFSAALKSYNIINRNNENLKQQVILGKAYSYFNMKDYSNAVFYFNEYITNYKNDPNINEATLRLADSYFGLKNFNKASIIYKELFSTGRNSLNNDLAYYQYGQSLFKSGKSKEAINAFENLQEKFPGSKYSDGSQYLVGWIYFQQNEFSNAIQNYQKLLVRYPRSAMKPIAYNSIGDAFYNSGQYDSSIVFYSRVLNEFPNSQYIFDAVSGIQYAYIAKEQPDNAITFIDQFISSNPNSKFSDQIFFKKGDLYYSIQNYQAAISSYKEFTSKYSGSPLIPNAYYWIGKSAANLKNDSEATDNFNIARTRSPESDIGISAAIEMSKIYSLGKQYSAAINVLNESINAVPTSNRIPELLFLLGKNLSDNNQSSEAASTFEQIMNYYDGSIFASKSKIELGIIELKNNNFEKAQIYFKEVGEKKTDDIGAQAQYYYGVALFNQNKIEDAITALVRVRSVFGMYDEWYTRSLLKLGDCFIKLKDKKQAREMFRAVLIRHETGEFADEAKKKMKLL